MPLAFARALIASSSAAGRRMFSDADLGSSSKRMGLNCDRSYSDRSAVATKSSAASSLEKEGIDFNLALIVRDLFLQHVAGTDRANFQLPAHCPQHEHQEDVPPGPRPPDCPLARPVGPGVRHAGRRPGHHLLDFFPGHAVLASFRPIPGIPVETRDLHFSLRLCVDKSKTNPTQGRQAGLWPGFGLTTRSQNYGRGSPQ